MVPCKSLFPREPNSSPNSSPHAETLSCFDGTPQLFNCCQIKLTSAGQEVLLLWTKSLCSGAGTAWYLSKRHVPRAKGWGGSPCSLRLCSARAAKVLGAHRCVPASQQVGQAALPQVGAGNRDVLLILLPFTTFVTFLSFLFQSEGKKK